MLTTRRWIGGNSRAQSVSISGTAVVLETASRELSGLRAKTAEIGYRAELRKSLSDTLSGAISYVEIRRDGSSWLRPLALPATGVTALSDSAIFNRTGIFPMIFMDRTRTKVKALADWSPMDRLSLQFTVEDGNDKYSAPTEKGLRDTGMQLYGVDASYALSDAWKLSAYYTYSEQTLHVSHFYRIHRRSGGS